MAPCVQPVEKAEEGTVMAMVVENGKITEITESELFSLYLDRGMDDIMDFREYRHRMEKAGCVVKDGDEQ